MGRGYLAPLRLIRPVREEFVDWWRSPESDRSPGRTCLAACQRLSDENRRWQEASRIGSKGCGANMRVAPIGLAPGLSEYQRSGAAQLQAGLTHGHPTALAAADLTARTVHLLASDALPSSALRHGAPHMLELLRAYAAGNRGRYHERWLGDLWRYAEDRSARRYMERGWDDCLTSLDRLEEALRHPDPEADPCLVTGGGWVAEEALATGLLCLLLFPGEPVTAIRRAACSSGDSDAIACLTGAFAGACYGEGAWPAEWAGRIEYREQLLELAAVWDG
jgi:ADP-ribosylglycohydrolase